VILLDHNIPEDQAEQLRRRRVHFRQIGFEVGRPEWDDQQEILRYLHTTKQATFFTRDLGFFRRRLCHSRYCLVVLAVPVLETAAYIRRVLRYPMLKTRAQRQGKVVRVSTDRIALWQTGQQRLINLRWYEARSH
jgi:hypothetical protein